MVSLVDIINTRQGRTTPRRLSHVLETAWRGCWRSTCMGKMQGTGERARIDGEATERWQ